MLVNIVDSFARKKLYLLTSYELSTALEIENIRILQYTFYKTGQ